MSNWIVSRRCAAPSWKRPASRSKITARDSKVASLYRSPVSRAWASAAAPTASAAARSPASISAAARTKLHHRAIDPGDPGGDLPGLPGEPHRAVQIVGVLGGEGQPLQG